MSGSGLGAAAAFYLGTVAADSARGNRDFLERMRHRREEKQEANLVVRLTAKAEEFLEHIEWQKGIMDQRKARIAELEAELAARNARVSEWERYGEVMERNHSRLRAWSNDAEAQLQRYHALYGPLPADKTSEK